MSVIATEIIYSTINLFPILICLCHGVIYYFIINSLFVNLILKLNFI